MAVAFKLGRPCARSEVVGPGESEAAPCPPRRGGPVSVWSPEDDLVAAFLRGLACARRDSHDFSIAFRVPCRVTFTAVFGTLQFY